MGWIKKNITGREIYEAIEEDGFGVMRGAFFSKGADGKPRACLMGGAGINLGVYAHAQQADQNESERIGIQEVLSREYVPEDSKWLKTIYSSHNPAFVSIASAIVGNFDKVFYNHTDLTRPQNTYERVSETNPNAGWYALTWDESLVMVRDLLTPVWDKVFAVDVFDYSTWDYVSKDEDTDNDYNDYDDEPDYDDPDW